MLDQVELWVTTAYGPITYSDVEADLVRVHCAAVAVMGGIVIGMGPTRQLAVHDLYEALVEKPTIPTALTGFWRRRRTALWQRGDRRPSTRDARG